MNKQDIINGLIPVLDLLSKGDITVESASKHLADHILQLIKNNQSKIEVMVTVEGGMVDDVVLLHPNDAELSYILKDFDNLSSDKDEVINFHKSYKNHPQSSLILQDVDIDEDLWE